MTPNYKMSWWKAAGVGAVLLAGLAFAPARADTTVRFGVGDHRLEGQRFTTMRGLAHRLDEAAQTVARVASDTPQERNGRMKQRFLWAINDFARQARSLHERLDNQYGNEPWDVADEVAALDQRARQVNRQIRSARAFPETYADWNEALNALNLMNRSLRGQEVAIPVADRRPYQPFDEQYRYSEGRHVQGVVDSGVRPGWVTGTPLREFRRLASSLNVESGRVVQAAEQGSNSFNRGDRSLADLRHFAQRTSDLNRSTGGDPLNSREIGPVVSQLMSDARQNERDTRENSLSLRVEWTESIRLLEQMVSIVQYQQ